MVTDGFTGNVALKSIEGTAKLYTGFVRDAFRTSTFAKIGYLFASGAWIKLRKRVDPRRYNGGVFLGLDGICVKSHGGTDQLGFAYAIGVAVDLVRYEFKSKLVEGLAKLRAGDLRRRCARPRRCRPPEELSDPLRRSGLRLLSARSASSPTTNWPRRIDTSDEWIRQRTGIRQRHIAADGEFTSHLALKASERALAHAGMKAADLDLIVLATATPDETFPATATRVQQGLGMTRGAAFDVQAVCAGFVYGVAVADSMIKSGVAVDGPGDRRRDLLAHPRLE